MQNYQPQSLAANFQRSMQLSSTQLHRLFDSLFSVVIAIDLDGKIVYVSKSSLSICDYLPEELIGKSYLDFLHEDDKQETENYFRRQIYGQETREFENRLIKRDGTIIYISWSGRWDAKDKMFYYVVNDITERKETEKQKEQYHLDILNILERITDGYFTVDSNWSVTFRNHQTEILTGKKHHQVLGKSLWSSYPELIESIVYEQFHKALTEQIPLNFEFYYSQSNSWLSFSVYPKGEGLSIFFKNINDKKQVEVLQLTYDENIKECNTYQRTVLDGFDQGFIALDEEEKVIHWNKKTENIFGTKYNAVYQKPLKSCLNTIDAIAFYQQYEKAYTNKAAGSFTIFLQHSNKWIETALLPIQKGIFIFLKDITSQKKAKEELLKLTAIAKRKTVQPETAIETADDNLEEPQHIATDEVIKAQERERELISKELHNNVTQVLTTVKLYTELCLSGAENKEKILRKSLTLLQSSILEINNLSRRLSPSQNGNVSLKDTLNELIESVAAINKLSISLDFKRGNNLDVSDELHLVVYKILQEHLTNISSHAKNVQIHINGTSNEFNLKVKDDGIGFDTAKQVNHIESTGMANRVQALKGILSINNIPGSGCELLVRFPMN
jgi:PAS domain S-box-containing protein